MEDLGNEIDDLLTQKVIKIIQNTPQCIQSVKQVPCDDYKARFGAWLRVKHGIKSHNTIDWPMVVQTINSAL